jgi:hypothetical protein
MEATWTTLSPHEIDLLEPATTPRMPGVSIGVIAVADISKGLWVTCEEATPDVPRPARTMVPITPADEGRSVVLAFAGGDPERPIVTGFLQAQPVVAPAQRSMTASLDGRQVRLEAEREIVLKCGKSSLTLRADGKVVLKGVEVVSRARRTNKVKGGTVRLN